MRHLAYRPEIDGLRALAIISVLIFHLNSNWLPGGFLGVDIFFVISGFLITKIITNEILDNRFSYKNFYNRRIKRIYPIFILVMAWETSTPSVQEKLENHHDPKILTIGDSHADHLYHFLNYVGNKEGWKSNILNVGECILFVNKDGQLKNDPECTHYWQQIEDYPVIFISMFYDIKRGNKPVPRFLPESFVLPNFDE